MPIRCSEVMLDRCCSLRRWNFGLLEELADFSLMNCVFESHSKFAFWGIARDGEGVEQTLSVARDAPDGVLLRILWLGSWALGFPDACPSRGVRMGPSTARPGACLGSPFPLLTLSISAVPAGSTPLMLSSRGSAAARPLAGAPDLRSVAVCATRTTPVTPVSLPHPVSAPRTTHIVSARIARAGTPSLTRSRAAPCPAPTPRVHALRPARSTRVHAVASDS